MMRQFFLLLTLLAVPALWAEAFDPPADSVRVSLTFDLDSLGHPRRRVFDSARCRDSVFFVISKIHQEHICVYEKRRTGDTVLLAAYPCCLSAIRGQKQHEGDCRTPESWPGKPFSIARISDLRRLNQRSTEFRKFGPFYHAVRIPGVAGVGIHGTNSPSSIGAGRRSHGCIRLFNEDITHMVENYSQVGNQVVILPEEQEPLPFEVRALRMVCGLDQGRCELDCGPGCFRVNDPCRRIHLNPKLDIRRAVTGL